MKKVLSLVLAIAMVLSSMSFAFAGTFEDVTDEATSKAVDALSTLGIVNGYTDGSYKPGNTVTRAEMAKLLVTALGHGDLAQGSSSSFKDAKGTWYDGYVAMAAGLGIVNGYPDGTFKGDSTVSYQEAVVMTLRTLGYSNSAVNGGDNNYNAAKYKALAANLGLLENVVFKSGGANRGDVAIIVHNSLDIPVVVINEDGKAEKVVAYTESETDPVTGITKTVNVYKLLIDNIAEAKIITVEPANIDPDSSEYLGKNIDLVPYMYQKVRAYFNVKGELLSIKKVLSNVVVGNNNSYRTDDVRHEAGTLQFKTTEGATKKVYTKYDGKAASDYDITVYLNGEETVIKASTLHTTYRTSKSTYVLDKNNFVQNAVIERATYSARVSEPYKTNSLVIKGQDDNKVTVNIYLPKDAAKVDLSKVIVTGDVTSIEDIAKNDIVTAYAAAGKNNGAPKQVKLVVSRNTVEGVVAEHSASGQYAVINDKTYYYDNTTVIGNVDAGSEGIFYLTAAGYIHSFDGKSISNKEYALVVDSADGYVPGSQVILKASITLFNKDSKTTKYNFASNAEYVLDGTNKGTVWGTNGHAKQDLVGALENAKNNRNVLVTGFNLNSSGDIAKIQLSTLDLETRAVDVDSKTFILSSDVVIYNAYPEGSDLKYSVMTEDRLKDAKAGDNVYFFDTNAEGEICAILYGAAVELPDYIVVTDIFNVYNNGKVVQKVQGLVNGEEVTYLTDASNVMDEDVCWDTLVKLTINAAGEISDMNVEPISVTTTGGAIKSFPTSNTFTYNGNRHTIADKGAIYVLERTNRNFFDTAVVGSVSDLSRTDVEVFMYNLDTTNDNGSSITYEVIVVRQLELTK